MLTSVIIHYLVRLQVIITAVVLSGTTMIKPGSGGYTAALALIGPFILLDLLTFGWMKSKRKA